MSYYCTECKSRRTQGCFGHGCPGIPTYYNTATGAAVAGDTPEETFRNAIRIYGVTNACEWFGHPALSQFTLDAIAALNKK